MRPPPSSRSAHLQMGLVYDLRADYLAQGWSEEDAAEFDADVTIDAIEKTLAALGHQVERIGNAHRLCRRLAAGARWDMVFNMAEGTIGRSRESQVPALLDLFNIPYTFSDPLVCAATLDKAVTKRILRDARLPTPSFHVVREPDDLDALDLDFPLFIKPLAEGSGKGIDAHSRIDSREELAPACRKLLERFQQPVLVEEFLPGREFTVGILGTGQRARVLGTLEVRVRDNAGGGIYSFLNKEEWRRRVEYAAPPADSLRQTIEDLGLRAHRLLECRDASRLDVRLDRKGQPSLLEINVLPGLNPDHSDLPMIARNAGWSFQDLIAAIVDSAGERLRSIL